MSGSVVAELPGGPIQPNDIASIAAGIRLRAYSFDLYKTKKKDEAEGDMALEMADILFVLICMANREGIDLQAAFDRMMAKVEARDTSRWTLKPGMAPPKGS